MATAFASMLFRRGSKLPIVEVPTGSFPVVFQRTPPFWAKWALVLISLDVMVATSAMEITWSHWRTARTEETPPDALPPLQPYWKRSSACVLHFMSGCLVAGSIMGLRSRLVRKITIAPPAPATAGFSGKRVFIETANNGFNWGVQVPARKAKVLQRNDRQLLLEVTNHGRWLLDLKGAEIGGKVGLTADSAKKMFAKALGDKAPLVVESPKKSSK